MIDLSGAYHVVPLDDRAEHDTRGICACHPDYQPRTGGLTVLHKAWDGREAMELDPFATV